MQTSADIKLAMMMMKMTNDMHMSLQLFVLRMCVGSLVSASFLLKMCRFHGVWPHLHGACWGRGQGRSSQMWDSDSNVSRQLSQGTVTRNFLVYSGHSGVLSLLWWREIKMTTGGSNKVFKVILIFISQSYTQSIPNLQVRVPIIESVYSRQKW